MIESTHAQGTQEWRMDRLGIPTASEFSQIVTPAKLAASASQEPYLNRLLSELISGEPHDTQDGGVETLYMARGKSLEADAFSAYALLTDRDPRKCGFCWQDERRRVGCSPDALVGDDGLLEIKCESLAVFLGRVRAPGLPLEHRLQVQGELWVTGRQWADFIAYYPGLPLFVHRTTADPVVFAAFGTHIPAFCDRLAAEHARLAASGYVLSRLQEAA